MGMVVVAFLAAAMAGDGAATIWRTAAGRIFYLLRRTVSLMGTHPVKTVSPFGMELRLLMCSCWRICVRHWEELREDVASGMGGTRAVG